MNTKFFVGLLLALMIGLGCRAFGVPSPAPPALIGALLVLSMTIGYQLADGWIRRKAPKARDADRSAPAGKSTPPGNMQ